MIKWMAAIILFAFIFPAAAHAATISHEKKQIGIHTTISCETANTFHDCVAPLADQVNTAQQNLQKTNRAQGDMGGQSFLQNAKNPAGFFPMMEISGNNRWHRNYPSHHFW